MEIVEQARADASIDEEIRKREKEIEVLKTHLSKYTNKLADASNDADRKKYQTKIDYDMYQIARLQKDLQDIKRKNKRTRDNSDAAAAAKIQTKQPNPPPDAAVNIPSKKRKRDNFVETEQQKNKQVPKGESAMEEYRCI